MIDAGESMFLSTKLKKSILNNDNQSQFEKIDSFYHSSN